MGRQPLFNFHKLLDFVNGESRALAPYGRRYTNFAYVLEAILSMDWHKMAAFD